MSGSPFFINGRLVGAIGYGWDFSDHNLGLVTPIEEMSKAWDWQAKEGSRGQGQVSRKQKRALDRFGHQFQGC